MRLFEEMINLIGGSVARGVLIGSCRVLIEIMMSWYFTVPFHIPPYTFQEGAFVSLAPSNRILGASGSQVVPTPLHATANFNLQLIQPPCKTITFFNFHIVEKIDEHERQSVSGWK
jgi:hypothetical protein